MPRQGRGQQRCRPLSAGALRRRRSPPCDALASRRRSRRGGSHDAVGKHAGADAAPARDQEAVERLHQARLGVGARGKTGEIAAHGGRPARAIAPKARRTCSSASGRFLRWWSSQSWPLSRSSDFNPHAAKAFQSFSSWRAGRAGRRRTFHRLSDAPNISPTSAWLGPSWWNSVSGALRQCIHRPPPSESCSSRPGWEFFGHLGNLVGHHRAPRRADTVSRVRGHRRSQDAARAARHQVRLPATTATGPPERCRRLGLVLQHPPCKGDDRAEMAVTRMRNAWGPGGRRASADAVLRHPARIYPHVGSWRRPPWIIWPDLTVLPSCRRRPLSSIAILCSADSFTGGNGRTIGSVAV